MEENPSDIPAATIQDLNLSGVPLNAASEIQRLGQLMERGEETPEQFAQLVRLLHQAGFDAKSEYLLRRNMDVVADGAALYRELYGTEKLDEFAAAIKAFGEQFACDLELVEKRDFLDYVYRTRPRSVWFDEFRLFSESCEVRFDYAGENVVEADVSSFADEKYTILHWINGIWEAADGSADNRPL